MSYSGCHWETHPCLCYLATGALQWAVDWCSCNITTETPQHAQNTSARILTSTWKHEHITPVLLQFQWLRVEYKIILLTYKALHGQALIYLSDLLQPHTSGRALRSTMRDSLWVPCTKLRTYGDRAFSAMAPRLWNSLPLGLWQTSSTTGFRKQLKTHLFGLAFVGNWTRLRNWAVYNMWLLFSHCNF